MIYYNYSSEMPDKVIRVGAKFYFRFDEKQVDGENGQQWEYIEVCIPTFVFDYDHLVSSIVRAKYSADNIEAILLNDDSAELSALQDWRDHAKSVAGEFFGVTQTIDGAKKEKLREIDAYDKSSAVNGFFLNGQLVWLDKATRVGLMNAVTIAKAAGKEIMTTWFGSWQIELNCDAAIAMLSALEMYAMECYNVTAQHRSAIEAATDIDAVRDFDITADYPARLEL